MRMQGKSWQCILMLRCYHLRYPSLSRSRTRFTQCAWSCWICSLLSVVNDRTTKRRHCLDQGPHECCNIVVIGYLFSTVNSRGDNRHERNRGNWITRNRGSRIKRNGTIQHVVMLIIWTNDWFHWKNVSSSRRHYTPEKVRETFQ